MISTGDLSQLAVLLNILGYYPGGGSGAVTPEQVQQLFFNYSNATGVDDAFIVTLTPEVLALTDGLTITMNSGLLQNLTTSPTLQVNSLTPKPITIFAGQPAPGDIQNNSSYIFIYNETLDEFTLVNPSITTANTFAVQTNAYNIALDTGVANAYIGNILPTTGALLTGYQVILQTLNTNTGASTLQSNGVTKPILDPKGAALKGGEILADNLSVFMYFASLDAFVLMNPKNYATSNDLQTNALISYPATGAANAYTLVNAAYTFVNTQSCYLILRVGAIANTGASTLAVNGGSLLPIVNVDGTALVAGQISASSQICLLYNPALSSWVLLNPTGYRRIRLSNEGILDINGLNIMRLSAVASAVNWAELANAVTGAAPVFRAMGSDPNVPLVMESKGTAGVASKGRTNGATQTTGYIGEEIIINIPQSGALNINNNTATNLLSTVVPAGNWQAVANISFLGAAGNINQTTAWISDASATTPDYSIRNGIVISGMNAQSLSTPTKGFRFLVPTTVYVSALIGLASGTATMSGNLTITRIS